MNRFGFLNLGQYLLTAGLISTCAIYYTNNNDLSSLNNTPVVLGQELHTEIKRDAVTVIGTLTRVTFRENSTTAVLNFISLDNYEINVLLPTSLATLRSKNLQIGQTYKITGTPLTRGVLSVRSVDQIEKSTLQQPNRVELICFRHVHRLTDSSGYGTLCADNTVVNYQSSVAVYPNRVYTGYWTQHFNTREKTFNITGFAD
jgi:hypothetical protein